MTELFLYIIAWTTFLPGSNYETGLRGCKIFLKLKKSTYVERTW